MKGRRLLWLFLGMVVGYGSEKDAWKALLAKDKIDQNLYLPGVLFLTYGQFTLRRRALRLQSKKVKYEWQHINSRLSSLCTPKVAVQRGQTETTELKLSKTTKCSWHNQPGLPQMDSIYTPPPSAHLSSEVPGWPNCQALRHPGTLARVQPQLSFGPFGHGPWMVPSSGMSWQKSVASILLRRIVHRPWRVFTLRHASKSCIRECHYNFNFKANTFPEPHVTSSSS